ncbi:MAG: DUF4915 domain-containing protein [Planctomycetota bacterium]
MSAPDPQTDAAEEARRRAAHQAWRDPAQVAAHWWDAARVEPARLANEEQGGFFELLGRLDLTLLVTREYEHLVLALAATAQGPRTSYLALPHPSGLAHDVVGGRVFVAATRNPNQVVELRPAAGALPRLDRAPGAAELDARPLLPASTSFYPGSLYLHDLAFLDGALHANACGQDAIVRLDGPRYERVWWPRSVDDALEGSTGEANRLQLNSIAAGQDLASSFFTASAAVPGELRPGDPAFPVDGRGVVLSGATREPLAGGLTRPHSARLHAGELWLANSGYGELGRVREGAFEAVARLEGWTRGLCLHQGVAFVGTSRVLPRFRAYAPGLDLAHSTCGVVAVELASGRVLASLRWPAGDQVFAVLALPRAFTLGFPFQAPPAPEALERLFYAYRLEADP